MIFLVDMGNTRIKWASLQNGDYHFGGSTHWRDQGLPAAISSSWSGFAVPDRVHVCNVAGAASARMILEWVSINWACETIFAKVESSAAELRNGYEQPQQMGVDRWVAMLAAWERHHAAACIVDCGTAITLDVVSESGHHLGGVIAPGISLMHEALASRTAQLPVVAIGSELALGRNTMNCIAAGCLATASGLIGSVAGLINELGLKDVRWIATGGDAETLIRVSPVSMEYVPDLVLHGLARLAGSRP